MPRWQQAPGQTAVAQGAAARAHACMHACTNAWSAHGQEPDVEVISSDDTRGLLSIVADEDRLTAGIADGRQSIALRPYVYADTV